MSLFAIRNPDDKFLYHHCFVVVFSVSLKGVLNLLLIIFSNTLSFLTAKVYRSPIKHILEPRFTTDEDDDDNEPEDDEEEPEEDDDSELPLSPNKDCELSTTTTTLLSSTSSTDQPVNMALNNNNAQAILRLLRSVMSRSKAEPLAALIVPTDDAHGSEYIAPCDARREYLSGFTGSAGTAVVTQRDARLWTDGRYFLQANNELDPACWKLMKDRQPDTPTIGEWLSKNLDCGSRVGADPFTLSFVNWSKLEAELANAGHVLVPTSGNLVDEIWRERPQRPKGEVIPLADKYTGVRWQEMIGALRMKMHTKGAEALIITALDDVAWMLNLRGNDIEYNPVFFAYVAVTKSQVV